MTAFTQNNPPLKKPTITSMTTCGSTNVRPNSAHDGFSTVFPISVMPSRSKVLEIASLSSLFNDLIVVGDFGRRKNEDMPKTTEKRPS